MYDASLPEASAFFLLSYSMDREDTLRVRLDVDIGDSGIELVPLPNQASIGNGLNTKSVVWM